ncbi:2Fe-2S iron-sulfur cluster-binding protein [Heliophilum fasciatum]|uniref:2Fe-2S iron-sulfur cluster protein n=1 Tax=Heliophilum fasciatum TaxID=35700 RepID=A0A4R2RVM7_9FIRM|nr:2Fe-2S iron-sulfur cluster-binding protein [Heliophilum fasciatum]MCW2278178.1 NADH dehydrogenase/NADH:ubiquinone oxidoreductase subunit G [Heliophilum fasciatum]TCP64001.1 2Fe-2S iron-sulfur cluster protein [Heliophilum fasciatum]
MNLWINNQMIEANEGQTILEAARVAGIFIPTLCDRPGYSPAGTCGVCAVEVEGEAGTVLACCTPVRENMRILVPQSGQLPGGDDLDDLL